jgi:hypothetical protein
MTPPLSTQELSGGGRPAGAQSGGQSAATGPSSSTAPSRPGGGGKTLADCMAFWEPATHMTKAEWRTTCLRTLKEYPDLR